MPKKLSIFKGRSRFRMVGDFLLEIIRKNPSLKAGTHNVSKISRASRKQFEDKMHSEEKSSNG